MHNIVYNALTSVFGGFGGLNDNQNRLDQIDPDIINNFNSIEPQTIDEKILNDVYKNNNLE